MGKPEYWSSIFYHCRLLQSILSIQVSAVFNRVIDLFISKVINWAELLKRYRHEIWRKYNYLVGSALDTGFNLAVLVSWRVVCLVQKMIKWLTLASLCLVHLHLLFCRKASQDAELVVSYPCWMCNTYAHICWPCFSLIFRGNDAGSIEKCYGKWLDSTLAFRNSFLYNLHSHVVNETLILLLYVNS